MDAKITESIEIDAEVFRVVRANQHMNKLDILFLLYDHLPDVPPIEIGRSLKRLWKRITP